MKNKCKSSNYRYTFKVSDFIKFHTYFLDRISNLLIITLLSHLDLYMFFKFIIVRKKKEVRVNARD